VVVVGYGVQKVATLTGSVAQIKSEKIAVAPLVNATHTLAGQLPGLISKQTSGIPGEDNASLRIRGFGSPLVIVDGIETHFDRLDVNQIESISILKDGSASIYGARAGQGVILVTTKRGKQGKPTATVNSSYSLVGSTRVIRPASSADRAQRELDAWLNSSSTSVQPWKDEEIQKFRDGSDPNYLNTDWFDASIRRIAPQQNHNLTITGGNEMIRYYGFFGYNNKETILKKNGGYYNRFNFQVNMDAKLSDQISAAMDMQYFNDQTYFPGTAGAIRGSSDFWIMIFNADPMYPLTLPDPSKLSYANIPYGNPVWATDAKLSGFNDSRNDNFQYKGELRYDFKNIPGLHAKGAVIYRTNKYEVYIAKNQESFYTYNADADVYSFIRLSQEQREMQRVATTSRVLVQQYSLNYSNTFLNGHTITGMFLYEQMLSKGLSFFTGRYGFETMALPEFFAGNATTAYNSSSSSASGRLSYVGRLNYSYKDRYMVETILRADASSRFAKAYRWGYFPGVSLGWNIANENFMNGKNSVDQLKLRLSYGASGNDGVANFAYISGFSYNATYTFGDQLMSTLVPTALANFLLSWEKMSIYNAGLDFSMWRRKLYGEIDVFYRERTGMPATRRASMPTTFGASMPTENLNSTSTSGLELRIGSVGKIGSVHYDISGNIGFSRTKWLFIDEPEYDDPDDIRLTKQTGRYTDRRIGYVFDGLFTSQAEVDQCPYSFESLNNNNSSLRPGDVKYKDLNGDGVINWRDQTEIGYGSMPNATFGLHLNIRYKNFDLSALCQGAFRYTTNIDAGWLPTEYFCTQYWHPIRNNRADALIPRPGGSSTNGFYSDYRNVNTAYMRLKYVSLGYEIPVSLLSRIGVEKFRIFVAGTNLFTISTLNKWGVDPEMPEGAIGVYYPQQFTMSIGCNLTF